MRASDWLILMVIVMTLVGLVAVVGEEEKDPFDNCTGKYEEPQCHELHKQIELYKLDVKFRPSIKQ